VREQFPESDYVGQSLYWEAFSLNRMGGDSERRHAIELLDGLGDEYPDVAEQASSLRMQIIGRLGRRGDPEAVARLAYVADGIAASNDAQRAIRAAALALEATNDARAASTAQLLAFQQGRPVIPPTPAMYGQRRQESQDVRLQALNALLQMDSDAAMPILRRLLQNRAEDNIELRRRAIFLVAQKSVEDREVILLDAARNDPDDGVREQAVFFLSQVQTDAAVDALDSILQHSTEARLQERAIFALAQHRSDRAGEILQRYVRRASAPAELRAAAVQWIGQRPGSDVFLRGLYPEITDEELKVKLLFALSQRRSEESAQFLIGIASNESEPIEVRKQALFWAGQMRIADDRLYQMYAEVTDQEMKEQLIFVYGQRRDSLAVNRLIDIAKDGSNVDLQGKAIFWLGQSRDPRAITVLEELVNR
jgi:HEAT repeat protein